MAETKTESRPKRKKGAKAVAKEYFEAVAAQNVDKMMSMWEPGGRGSIYGMVELEAPGTYSVWFRNLFNAFPDFEFGFDQARLETVIRRHGLSSELVL